MNILTDLLIFIFGSAIGSFLNVAVLRLPEKKTLGGRSHCPSCGRVLTFWDLWPILSYIFLKGRCRHCGSKISSRYPLIEAVTGVLFVVTWLYLAPASGIDYVKLLSFWVLSAFCVLTFVIDLEHYLILDRLVFPTAVVFIILNLLIDIFGSGHRFGVSLGGLAGAAFGVLPFWAIWFFSKGRLMGFGDVKLMLALGLGLGWPKIVPALLIAVLTGTVVGVFLLIWGKKRFNSPLPFGCFLALGAFLAQLFGLFLIHWYLAFLGI